MSTDGFTTCLWFDGQAEEAADFYVSLFENSERGRTVRATEAGPGPAGSVVTVDFVANGQKFVGLNGGPEFTFTEAVSFQIDCADQTEVDFYSRALVEGGGEQGPCGWVKDRFGVSWQVVPARLTEMISDPDRARAGRAMGAMLTMHKLDIAALERAYAGE
ncbi:putative 3-demethylubiquinone-9 3-methyltransferase (glyoxalase superfamily) [Streptomyces sp. V3I8]|uniref:VOC family protein n=1 Tax=Streptomyces sp. V3I8 TaxID=3042279 RepID=UPI002781EBCF|nr:VOC family protein [Streptomyces sp. V3I8]MDQ1040811.1 putative 3-demethylubiquinone-9 3-methyltransferase (glyoxalase superfamily) [Streptomyces sp. V3I8]